MIMRNTAIVVVGAAFWTISAAAADCPAAVTDAVMKAHLGASVSACKQETEEGKVQFEVKLVAKGGAKMEVDVSPEGRILLTEEYVALGAVPPAVLKSLKAKHPDAKALKAAKQTDATGKIAYEVAFETAGKKHEARFAADGAAIEEEDDEGQD